MRSLLAYFFFPAEKHRERHRVLIFPSLELICVSVVPFLLWIALKMKEIKYLGYLDPLLLLPPLKNPRWQAWQASCPKYIIVKLTYVFYGTHPSCRRSHCLMICAIKQAR